MSELIVALALCIASAAGYAAAAVLQERLADRPIGVLVRMPVWWAAIALNGIGGALHVVALRYGPLSLVQPFGVLTLVLAVPLGAVIARRAVTRVEWRGILLTMAGLAGILVLAGTTGGIAVLSTAQLVGLLLVTAAVLTALGGWSAVPGASGLWAAAAAGVAFGVSSALTQTVAVHLTDDGLTALLSPMVAVPAAAIVALSVAGLLFTQRSYRAGLGAPLAVSTLANPVAAAAIGLLLLQEQIAGGPVGALVAVVAAIAAAAGVSLLTRTQTEPIRAAQIPAAQIPADQILAAQISADQISAEPILAGQISVEQISVEPLPVGQIRAEQVHSEPILTEPIRVDQIRADQIRAEQVRAEQVRADQVRAEQVRAEQVRVERVQSEQVESERTQVGQVPVVLLAICLPCPG